MAVEIERPRRLFTIEEYEKMVETGILTTYDRVELIEGEIVEMSPIGDAHASCVANLDHRGDHYIETARFTRGQSVAPAAFPDTAIAVDAIFA
jgi:Uma2 family endonuclease